MTEKRLPRAVWSMVLESVPIACTDVIVERNSQILLGLRVIEPYMNVWALPGGRILKNEHPEGAVERNLKEIGIRGELERFVGVFPVRFPNHPQRRYDITLCYKARWRSGEPRANAELARFRWVSPKSLPTRMGRNYRRMILSAFPT